MSGIKTWHLSTEKCRMHLLHTGKLKLLICGLNANVVPVCLCIHFPCGLSLKSWSINPVTVSSRTRAGLFHLVHNPATREQQRLWIHSHHYMLQKICWCRCLHKGTLCCLHPLLLACIYEHVWECLNVMHWTNTMEWSVYFCNPIHKSRIRHKLQSNRDKLCS